MELWEKLGLDPDRCRVVALTGAGGKTSTLYALAHEAAEAGRTVIVTTTTHIRPHPRLEPVGEASPDRLRALAEERRVLLCGRREPTGKLTLAAPVEACRAAAGVVVVEADGARMLPLKAPADHEPAVPPCAGAVVAVAGMDGVGRAVEAVCHRPERVRALLDVPEGHILTPADAAALLAHPLGGRKGAGEGMAFRCLLNKADTPQRLQYARQAAELLARRGIASAIHCYAEEERGGLCWF